MPPKRRVFALASEQNSIEAGAEGFENHNI
jgi:hypothetical protein